MTWDRGALRRIDRFAADAVEAAADFLEEASNDLVPVEEGDLRLSSRVSVDREGLSASVSYHDPAAVPQHERLDYQHDTGQSKFLETALHSNERQLREVMAGELRRGLL